MSQESLTSNLGADQVGNTWFIVCKHLVKRPHALTWNEHHDNRGVMAGYLCDRCKIGWDRADLLPLAKESVEGLRGGRQ